MKGDASHLVQNASGANTVIVKWQGHAGRDECGTSIGDRVSWRLKPEAVWPRVLASISGEWNKVLLQPFTQWSIVGESVTS